MKIFTDYDDKDYISIEPDGRGNINLSIRTTKDSKNNVIITSNITLDILDKIIAGMLSVKNKVIGFEKK